MKALGIRLSMSTAYHPQLDGQIERVNQSLETCLRCMCILQPKEWHRWLTLTQWRYNSNHHSSLKMLPFEALFGYKPAPLLAMRDHTTADSVEEYLQQRRGVLRQLKQELASVQNRMKQVANWRRSDRVYSGGESVFETETFPPEINHTRASI